VSLKTDKIEYRAVIKFFVKEGLTPNEVHSKFIKVYGDSSPSYKDVWPSAPTPTKRALGQLYLTDDSFLTFSY
jgi:hypothetical protein